MSATAAVRIGGQALADGVLMRTSRAWAVARDDGSVEVGEVPRARLARVPVARIVVALATGIGLAVGRGLLGRGSAPSAPSGRSAASARVSRRRNLRFLWVLLGVEAAGLAVTTVVGGRSLPAGGAVLVALVPWVLAFALLRLAAPASLWRYHGAEHKAVAAHESGLGMDDLAGALAAPRVHDRCGTNLVVLAMVGGLALTWLPAPVQVPAFLLLLGTCAEAVTLAARRPRWWLSRAVLGGGRALQRWVTTSEPTPAEQAVGCRALAACLAHHHRLVGGAGGGELRVAA